MIDELISKEHIDVIVEQLLMQSRKIQAHELNERQLEYMPYCTMRKKHNNTGRLLSVFAPDRFYHEEICVTDVYYGLHDKLGQPELALDEAVIQIYSNGSDLKGKIISERCEKYNNSEESRPQFLIMVVTINDVCVISGIELRRPDKSAKVVEVKTLYTNVVQLASVG